MPGFRRDEAKPSGAMPPPLPVLSHRQDASSLRARGAHSVSTQPQAMTMRPELADWQMLQVQALSNTAGETEKMQQWSGGWEQTQGIHHQVQDRGDEYPSGPEEVFACSTSLSAQPSGKTLSPTSLPEGGIQLHMLF